MKLSFPKNNYTTSFKERSSFWCYGIGMIFYYMIVGSYMNTYLLLQGIDLKAIALILLLVKVWDAVNDPLFAFIFDRVKFKKEKCLPWLRFAAVLMPIASILVFQIPANWTHAGKLVWFTFSYMLWDAAYTICDVPFFSMTTTMSTDMNERNLLFSNARFWHGFGNLACTTMMTWFVGEKCGMSFSKASIIVCAIGALFTIPLFFWGKERYGGTENQVTEEGKEEQKYTVKEMFTYLKQNKYLLIMYGTQMLCGCFAVGGAAGMVGTYYLYGQTSFGIITTWLNMLPGPIIALIMPYILKRFDRFKVYMTCNLICFAWSLVSFSAYFLGFLTVPFAILSSCITAFPSTMSGFVAYMFTLDSLEYGRYKTGIDGTGINFAVQTFYAKFPGAIASALGAFLLSLTSFVMVEAESIADLANFTQTQEAITEMYLITSLPGMISAAVCYTVLLCFYKLRSKDVAIMAKYNAGEITREECDSQLSRKY